MIATSHLLVYIALLITTAFHPYSGCIAFLDKPILTRSSRRLSSYTGTSFTVFNSRLKSKNGSVCRDTAHKTPWNSPRQQNADKTNIFKMTEIGKENLFRPIVLALYCTMAFWGSTRINPVMATDDAASATIAVAVQNLMEAAGDKDKSFEALKNVADIITDGKGIGGSLSYSGSQLESGLTSDEDTLIYNPGLTLLSESEKNSLVKAVIQNRKSNMLQNSWSEDNQLGYEFLKQKLDPFHTVELKGYLKILPFFGAAVYLATLFVQQNARQFFTPAYIAGAIAIFAPIFVLISMGP